MFVVVPVATPAPVALLSFVLLFALRKFLFKVL
jgi:hypothetical protein